MKKIVFTLLVLFAASSAQAQCLFFPFLRHEQMAQKKIVPSGPLSGQEEESPIPLHPENLSEANAYMKAHCLEDALPLVEELVAIEDNNQELAKKVRGNSDAVLRLNIASEIASRYQEEALSRRFSLEAEVLETKQQQEVSAIWVRNAEAQIVKILGDKEPFNGFLEKFSPEYAKELAGRNWLDSVAFWNWKLLAKEETGEEFDDLLLWAAFRLIPLEEFHGTRRGLLPSAMFSTADRFKMEELVNSYSHR